MRALTIYQPFASSLLLGLKKYETRSWKTNYRGPLVIHAGLKLPKANYIEKLNLLMNYQFKDTSNYQMNPFELDKKNKQLNYLGNPLPLGAAIMVVDLVDCIPITDEFIIQEATPVEMILGEYIKGYYAWKLENPRILIPPVPCKGNQGFWNLDIDLETLGF